MLACAPLAACNPGSFGNLAPPGILGASAPGLTQGAPVTGASSAPGLTQGAPATTPAVDGKVRVQGRVLAPAGALGYRTATTRQEKAAGILVYLTTPDERLYVDSQGKAVTTTTDAEGRYELPASVDQPLVVTAVLAGNRRLVGFTRLTGEGTASLDITLGTTYVTEFARAQTARAGSTIAALDGARLASLAALTGSMLEAGELGAAPDLTMSEIPALADQYMVAFSSRRRDVADAWAALLGFRPLAVTTLEDSVDPGFEPTAIAVNPAGPEIYVAAVSNTGVMIREVTSRTPVFRGLVSQGFWDVEALAVAPDGKVYFVERVDRFQGGALSKADDPPQIRLFSFRPGTPDLDEDRLAIPPELAAYAADSALRTRLEPYAVAFNNGKVYLSDFATGLIYEYTSGSSPWAGHVFAGRLQDGRPAKGNAAGAALGGAAFGALTHIRWHGPDLYVADAENSVVRAIGADGTVRDVVGTAGAKGFEGDGGPPLSAKLYYPGATAIDAAGRLFVADGENRRIRVVEGGKIRTIVGGGTPRGADGDALDVNLGPVGDLQFDRDGNLLFTDTGTRKVRKLWLQYGM